MPNDLSPIEPEGPERSLRIMGPDSEAPDDEAGKTGEVTVPKALTEMPDYELRLRLVNAWQLVNTILDAIDDLRSYAIWASPFAFVGPRGPEFLPGNRDRCKETRITWALKNSLNDLSWIRISSGSFVGKTANEVLDRFRPDDLFHVFNFTPAEVEAWQGAVQKWLSDPKILKKILPSDPDSPGPPPLLRHPGHARVDEVLARLDPLWYEMATFRRHLVLNPRDALTPPNSDESPLSGTRPEDAPGAGPSDRGVETCETGARADQITPADVEEFQRTRRTAPNEVKLFEILLEKPSATFAELAERIHNGLLEPERAIKENVRRTNKSLRELGIPIRICTGGGKVFREAWVPHTEQKFQHILATS